MTPRNTLRTVLLSALTTSGFAQTSPGERIIQAPEVKIEESRLGDLAVATSQIALDFEPGGVANPVASVADVAPNLFLAESGARSFTNSLSLRGLSNTPLFGDASVAVYLDDLPLGSVFAFPTELAGLENAELVRGLAHNTAFGRAGTAGLLRFNTPAAGAEGGEFRASYGNYASRTAKGSVAAKVGESELYAAVGYSARDGFIDNVALGRDIDWRESTSALARLRLTPRAGMEVRILATAQRVRDGVQALVPLGGPHFEVDRSAEGTTPMRSYGLSGHLAFATPYGALSATTSYTDWRLTGASNVLDLGFAELVNRSVFGQKLWSQEIKFEAEPRGDWRWSGGAFASVGETAGGFDRSIFGAPYESSVFDTDQELVSAFAEAVWSGNAGWRVSAGLRAEASWKEISRVETVPMSRTYRRKAVSTALLPRLALAYQWDDQAEASIGIGSSYKPGGFSAFTGDRALSRFGPERNVGLDAAYVRRGADGRWDVALRGFAYAIEGYQIERSFQTGGFADDYLVVNAARARSLGTELEFTWRPAPGLTAEFGLGLTDITLRDFTDPYTGARYDGNTAPLAPEHDLHLSLSYLHSSGFAVGAEVARLGRTYYTEDEDQQFSQSSYTRVSGRLGYVKGRFEFWLYGENLLDREYYTSILPGTFHATPGAPLTYGVSAGLKF